VRGTSGENGQRRGRIDLREGLQGAEKVSGTRFGANVCISLELTATSCGRHECGRVCCPLSWKAKASRSKRRPDEVPLQDEDDAHVCPLTCGKLLGCGLHTCPKPDHKGACGRCLQASYDEVSDDGVKRMPRLTPYFSSFATAGTPLSTHPWPAARPSPVFSLAPATHHLVATPSPRTTATSRPSAHLVPISPPSPAHAARIPR
jgi:hypothetical protein